jgi:hypothetical protein
VRDDAVPQIVRAAGDDAVRAYQEFLNDPVRATTTRKLYRLYAGRFFRWAESRGMNLETITAESLSAYAAEIAAAKSQLEATIYLTPVRGALGHLARSGVLATDPCPKGQPNGRGTQTMLNGPAPSIPLSELKRMVLEAGTEDGWEEGVEEFEAGLVILAPFSIGTRDPAAVAAYTGVPEPLVREFAERLIANGIWRPDGKIGANWFDPEYGDFAFMLDVFVALGDLERCPAAEDDAAQAEAETVAAGDQSA